MFIGLDVLSRPWGNAVRKRLADGKFGVLTHSAAVNEKGQPCLDVLARLDLTPSIVFSPEHGLDGLVEAEVAVEQDDSPARGVPVVSLYGIDRASLTPSSADLAGLDVLLIDLVDVGSRYYTYIWTALLAIRAAAKAGVHALILDRPNPISGDPSRLEGAAQTDELFSFVGLEPVPIRHCMTIAELLLDLLSREGLSLGPDGAVSVVATEGWERFRLQDPRARPFVAPSPNMPTLETALVYPGGCLLEATNLSEGRGTTRPFQLIGAPFLDGPGLVQALGAVDGAWIIPARFRPAWGKHAGNVCSGILVHVENERAFRPVATYLRIIREARALAPEHFELLRRPYEFETDSPAFDLLTGTLQARSLLEAGASADDLCALVCPVDPSWRERISQAEARLGSAKAGPARTRIVSEALSRPPEVAEEAPPEVAEEAPPEVAEGAPAGTMEEVG
jgi:uncharacterized protein YbbC (DUF1343 family)